MENNSIFFSTYFSENDPNRFGGNQKDYCEKSNMAIQKALIDVKNAVEEKRDLKQLFFSILDDFAKERHEIAISHATKNASEFGRSRLYRLHEVDFTGLTRQYEPFNKKMLEFLADMLKNEIPIKGGLTKKKIEKKKLFLVESVRLRSYWSLQRI